MNESKLYTRLKKAANDGAGTSLVSLVNDVYTTCVEVSKAAIKALPEYTLHDRDHIDGVIERMDLLIPTQLMKRLQPLEAAGLIMAAALHDIGMAPSEDEVRQLKLTAEGSLEEGADEEYAAFREGFQTLLKKQTELRADEHLVEAGEIEGYLVGEFLRQNHGERTREFIAKNLEDKLAYRDVSFAKDLADVCASHTQDPLTLENIECWDIVGPRGEWCNWRFVAVMLRLADILDFDPKRTPKILFEHLKIRDKVSVGEWKKHIAVKGWDIKPGRVAFSASCPDPVIEKALREFLRAIESELSSARAAIAGMQDPGQERLSQIYDLKLPTSIDDRRVGPEKTTAGPIYEFIDLGFHLDQDSIKSLLMGLRLYGEAHLFLRELLQNAADACRHRKALHQSQSLPGEYKPEIAVRLFEEDEGWFLEVEDNGIGMDIDVIKNHFAKIGSSYYLSRRFLVEKAASGLGFQPTAQFGLGVLSVFMAGESLRVETRRLGESAQPMCIDIASEGALFWLTTGSRRSPGTLVRVKLKIPPDNLRTAPPEGWLRGKRIEKEAVIHETIKELAPHVGIPITIDDRGISKRLPQRWSRFFMPTVPQAEVIELDLSSSKGDLEGRARVYLLFTKGKYVERVRARRSWKDLSRGAKAFWRWVSAKGAGDLESWDEPVEVLFDRLTRSFLRESPVGRSLLLETSGESLPAAREARLSDKNEREAYRLAQTLIGPLALEAYLIRFLLGDVWHDFSEGSLEHFYLDDERNSLITGSSVSSHAKISQLGFTIEGLDFTDRLTFTERGTKRTNRVSFPFPVRGDINLTGDLVLPLTVDRKDILQSDESETVLASISGELARALFRKIGIRKLNANKEFFQLATTGAVRTALAELIDLPSEE